MTQITPSEDCYKDDVFIETITGHFRFAAPNFDIEDIAHALSMLCRFNGHITHFYSVAQHSLMVADLMDLLGLGDPMEGLLHDATETYLSDVPAPVKNLLPDWKRVDADLDAKMRAHFKLPTRKSEGCAQADWIALFIEARALQPRRGVSFHDPHGYREIAADIYDNHRIMRPGNERPETVRARVLLTYERYALERK